MFSEGERMLGGLLRASHLSAMEDLPRLVAEHAKRSGFSQTAIYVADLRQELLIPLPDQHDAHGRPLHPLRIDTTLAGRAFRDIQVVHARRPPEPGATGGERPIGNDFRRLWIPLIDASERIGVLGVTVSGDEETDVWRACRLGTLISLLVVSKRDQSDTYAKLVRTRPLTLPAEVLRNLMPPGTFANEDVIIAAALEPAYDVGGDVFDYGVDGDRIHLSIFDAMGHDVAAGLTASIALGSYRNNRRRGIDLVTTGDAIDKAIDEQFGGTRFATGIMAVLDIRTGLLTWVNYGHHPPLVLRQGRQVATLESAPAPPLGLRLGVPGALARYQLEPGDRLLFYTDGIIEAQHANKEVFGTERFTDFIIRHEADGMSAPETVRRLIHSVLEYHHGVLQDDATVLLLEWRAQRQWQLSL